MSGGVRGRPATYGCIHSKLAQRRAPHHAVEELLTHLEGSAETVLKVPLGDPDWGPQPQLGPWKPPNATRWHGGRLRRSCVRHGSANVSPTRPCLPRIWPSGPIIGFAGSDSGAGLRLGPRTEN